MDEKNKNNEEEKKDEKKKKSSKLKKWGIAIGVTITTIGVGCIVYAKCPKFQNFIQGCLPKKKEEEKPVVSTVGELKTKPFVKNQYYKHNNYYKQEQQ